MKQEVFFSALLFFLAASPAFAAENKPVAQDCYKTAMSQSALDMCSDANAKKARVELDEELTAIKAQMAGHPQELAKLEKAQETWEAYILAQVDLLYFDHGGSVVPMCDNNMIETLIRERTKQLKEWNSPIEGDVCGWYLPNEYGQ